MPLTPGTRLGPYEILAPLGAVGLGKVYKGRDPRLEHTVAIKVSSEQFSERFEREARAIAALNHPNICQIYDVGPNYLVMELIEGVSPKGPLPLDQALKYGSQICDALDAAHKKGITHRDLKPANILVTKKGVKLLDFGLAKFAQGDSTAGPLSEATSSLVLTGRTVIVGTLFYMSPEQLQAGGQEIDGRSDIFSFGLVLYEMLTGKRAFQGSSPATVIAAILERPAPSIADVAPPALDRLLQRCLAKDPDERWQNARDLKAELEWIASRPDQMADVSARRRGGGDCRRRAFWIWILPFDTARGKTADAVERRSGAGCVARDRGHLPRRDTHRFPDARAGWPEVHRDQAPGRSRCANPARHSRWQRCVLLARQPSGSGFLRMGS